MLLSVNALNVSVVMIKFMIAESILAKTGCGTLTEQFPHFATNEFSIKSLCISYCIVKHNFNADGTNFSPVFFLHLDICVQEHVNIYLFKI